MQTRILRMFALLVGLAALAILAFLVLPQARVAAAPDVFASPINGGCYISGPSECRLHFEPFTINLTATKKLVFFQLVAIRGGTGVQTVIYDFQTDISNPPPAAGSTYTPSLVALDYAATCGAAYQVSLQGKDSGDAGAYNLGMTTQITCPATMP